MTSQRDEIIRSKCCGCFYCLATFEPTAIREWVDEIDGVGQTALCPICGIDSVIGSGSADSLDPETLRALQCRAFGH